MHVGDGWVDGCMHACMGGWMHACMHVRGVTAFLDLSRRRRAITPLPHYNNNLKKLAERKVALKRHLIVVFIANEVSECAPLTPPPFSLHIPHPRRRGIRPLSPQPPNHNDPHIPLPHTAPNTTQQRPPKISHRPPLPRQENNSVSGIGVDGLMAAGALDQIKNGPLFWVRACLFFSNLIQNF